MEGMVKACGKQAKGAIIAFLGFYAIGIPLAGVFMFVVKIDIYGFWAGYATGRVFTNILLFVLIKRFDWKHIADFASSRSTDNVIHQSWTTPAVRRSSHAVLNTSTVSKLQNTRLRRVQPTNGQISTITKLNKQTNKNISAVAKSNSKNTPVRTNGHISSTIKNTSSSRIKREIGSRQLTTAVQVIPAVAQAKPEKTLYRLIMFKLLVAIPFVLLLGAGVLTSVFIPLT
ncbi:unnamed protein product [Didymodactylos carnosus]|uniref:Uncharacterized protein n=1 Tax=Didymodactylos carnosus TaxID=1234261 RepID=A0A814XXG7_9BILA|nr:unnamed protein product [Didymodactylos carnosus]CAF1553234.1 unnamed protein product [Didymodactylos carnosus]CAF3984922.1 unnamed protein product [Didymodactylos carnosus]CAF4343728.1 unnamed protein product [Didymodactylos carnosus]